MTIGETMALDGGGGDSGGALVGVAPPPAMVPQAPRAEVARPAAPPPGGAAPEPQAPRSEEATWKPGELPSREGAEDADKCDIIAGAAGALHVSQLEVDARGCWPESRLQRLKPHGPMGSWKPPQHLVQDLMSSGTRRAVQRQGHRRRAQRQARRPHDRRQQCSQRHKGNL